MPWLRQYKIFRITLVQGKRILESSVQYRFPVVWMGDSLDNIRSFPPEVHTAVGYTLQLVQAGETPMNVKPLSFEEVELQVEELIAKFDEPIHQQKLQRSSISKSLAK